MKPEELKNENTDVQPCDHSNNNCQSAESLGDCRKGRLGITVWENQSLAHRTYIKATVLGFPAGNNQHLWATLSKLTFPYKPGLSHCPFYQTMRIGQRTPLQNLFAACVLQPCTHRGERRTSQNCGFNHLTHHHYLLSRTQTWEGWSRRTKANSTPNTYTT